MARETGLEPATSGVTGRTQRNNIMGIPKIAIKKSLAISVSALSDLELRRDSRHMRFFMSTATLTLEVSMSFQRYLQEILDDCGIARIKSGLIKMRFFDNSRCCRQQLASERAAGSM
jgi:hypothetical protein